MGESVQVIQPEPLEPNIIVLTKNWKGEVSDHSDLEIWLAEEKTFFRNHVRFCCEIYSFGTRVVTKGSIEASLGQRIGSTRMAHRRPVNDGEYETVHLDSTENAITIGDAIFRILG